LEFQSLELCTANETANEMQEVTMTSFVHAWVTIPFRIPWSSSTSNTDDNIVCVVYYTSSTVPAYRVREQRALTA
jgi:hypothetical protein